LSESLCQIDMLPRYCNDTAIRIGTGGRRGKLLCSSTSLFDKDCSTLALIMLNNEIKYKLKWLMESLLTYI
jgi:hypothetical protein